MIQHIVLLALSDDHDHDALSQVMRDLSDLAFELPGFTGFHHGPNRDFEDKSPQYPYGFVCTFTDHDALQRYAADPRHQALGARLVGMCQGGADGIMVADLDSGTEGAQ